MACRSLDHELCLEHQRGEGWTGCVVSLQGCGLGRTVGAPLTALQRAWLALEQTCANAYPRNIPEPACAKLWGGTVTGTEPKPSDSQLSSQADEKTARCQVRGRREAEGLRDQEHSKRPRTLTPVPSSCPVFSMCWALQSALPPPQGSPGSGVSLEHTGQRKDCT